MAGLMYSVEDIRTTSVKTLYSQENHVLIEQPPRTYRGNSVDTALPPKMFARRVGSPPKPLAPITTSQTFRKEEIATLIDQQSNKRQHSSMFLEIPREEPTVVSDSISPRPFQRFKLSPMSSELIYPPSDRVVNPQSEIPSHRNPHQITSPLNQSILHQRQNLLGAYESAPAQVQFQEQQAPQQLQQQLLTSDSTKIGQSKQQQEGMTVVSGTNETRGGIYQGSEAKQSECEEAKRRIKSISKKGAQVMRDKIIMTEMLGVFTELLLIYRKGIANENTTYTVLGFMAILVSTIAVIPILTRIAKFTGLQSQFQVVVFVFSQLFRTAVFLSYSHQSSTNIEIIAETFFIIMLQKSVLAKCQATLIKQKIFLMDFFVIAFASSNTIDASLGNLKLQIMILVSILCFLFAFLFYFEEFPYRIGKYYKPRKILQKQVAVKVGGNSVGREAKKVEVIEVVKVNSKQNNSRDSYDSEQQENKLDVNDMWRLSTARRSTAEMKTKSRQVKRIENSTAVSAFIDATMSAIYISSSMERMMAMGLKSDDKSRRNEEKGWYELVEDLLQSIVVEQMDGKTQSTLDVLMQGDRKQKSRVVLSQMSFQETPSKQHLLQTVTSEGNAPELMRTQHLSTPPTLFDCVTENNLLGSTATYSAQTGSEGKSQAAEQKEASHLGITSPMSIAQFSLKPNEDIAKYFHWVNRYQLKIYPVWRNYETEWMPNLEEDEFSDSVIRITQSHKYDMTTNKNQKAADDNHPLGVLIVFEEIAQRDRVVSRQLDTLLRHVCGSISNDFTRCLTTIFSAAQSGITNKSVLPEFKQLYLTPIKSACKSMKHQLQNLREFSGNTKYSRLKLQIRETCIPQVAQDAATLFNISMNKNINFQVKIDEDVPILIQADSKRLTQAVMVLLQNAYLNTIDKAPNSRTEITLRVFFASPIPQSNESVQHYLRFQVEDSGEAMSEQKQQHVRSLLKEGLKLSNIPSFAQFGVIDLFVCNAIASHLFYTGDNYTTTSTRHQKRSGIQFNSSVDSGNCFYFDAKYIDTYPTSALIEEQMIANEETEKLPNINTPEVLSMNNEVMLLQSQQQQQPADDIPVSNSLETGTILLGSQSGASQQVKQLRESNVKSSYQGCSCSSAIVISREQASSDALLLMLLLKQEFELKVSMSNSIKSIADEFNHIFVSPSQSCLCQEKFTYVFVGVDDFYAEDMNTFETEFNDLISASESRNEIQVNQIIIIAVVGDQVVKRKVQEIVKNTGAMVHYLPPSFNPSLLHKILQTELYSPS